VSSAWASATIEEFEQVSLENGTELFRVRARAPVGDDPEPRPLLACGTPEQSRTYEPVSSGGDRRGLLRLAYAVPAGLVGPAATFALELPEGARIELPEPAPGPSRADTRRGRRADDAPRRALEAGSEPASSRDELMAQGARALEQAHERLQRRVDELTAQHAALRAERDEALREAAEARTQRDAALQASSEAAQAAQATRTERDAVLEATAASRAAHAQLTRRLRQHEARFELLRADAQRTEAAFGPGTIARLRRLETEREQLVGHVRALAELLAVSAPAVGTDRRRALNGAAERVVAARDRAVRAAHEQAERDLEQMLADRAD
jgi:hypothetical protein